MNELLAKALAQARGAWRFRWHALAAAWAVALAGWAFVWFMPNTYEARTRVYVDVDSVLKPLLAGLAVGTDERSRVATMAKVFLSRPALEKVARETDLYLRVKGPEGLESLVRSLGKKITLITTQDGIYTLTYTDADPKMAQRVVQTLLNFFVEDTLGLKRQDSSSAQSFLAGQIKEYEAKLKTAEERLADFKRKNVGLMPGQGGDYYTRLQTALVNLGGLKAKQTQLTERRNELSRQLEGEEPTFGLVVPSSAKAGRNDSRIAELKSKIEALLVQYTDKHPEVIAARETIGRLEAENKQSGPAAPARAETDPSRRALTQLDINPVYQNMKLALSQTAADLAELRAQIAQQETEVAALRSRVNSVPEVEAQLPQLNRDYEINRAQYNALVQRLESGRLSEQAEKNSENVKFRIVDPPIVPILPSGPNRVLLLTGVFLLSLAAGAALALLLNEMKPVFATRSSVTEVTGLTVLGAISLASSLVAAPWYRRQPLLVSGGAALLAVVYIGNLIVA